MISTAIDLWDSTGNALEAQLFRFKDALLVIDNYVPGQTARGHQQLVDLALRVIQAIGDRSGRGRLDRNLEERATRRPRGLALMTGEDLPPTNESTIGRLIVVDVPKNALKLEKLAAIQDEAHRLPHAMRGFIEWLAPRIKTDAPSFRRLRRETASSYRTQLLGAEVHERAPNALAALAVGFGLFLDFAIEVGALAPEVSDTLRNQVDEALLKIARKQKANVEGQKPTERYLSSLRALLMQGRVVLAQPDEQLDKDTTAATRAIGWLDDKNVYLVPDLAWEAVEHFNSREGWPYRKTQLHKLLADQGIVEREAKDDDESRLTVRRTLGGKSQRVLKLDRKQFDNALPDPERTRVQKQLEEARQDDLRYADIFENGIGVESHLVN